MTKADYVTAADAAGASADPGVILPAGHDVEGSSTFVPEHLRADYAAIVDIPDSVRLTHRDYLASRLYDEGAAQLERESIADYVARYSVDEHTARRYLCGISGNFVVSADDSTRLHKLYDVGGTAWPDDASARIAHTARLELATRAVRSRASAAAAADAARCPMCLEVRPKQTQWDDRASTRDASVSNRVPVPGLPPVRCCGQCAVVIAAAAVERIAAYDGAAGMTRGELAAQWLDSQLSAPAIVR
jgi:hypothetical protein